MSDETNAASAGIRVDKWLWYARFFKSRSLAAKLVQSRKLRINSLVTTKASATVKAEDVLTFAQGRNIRVVRIVNIGTRRGPASEAQALYEDLAPLQSKESKTDPASMAVAKREAGAGRPTKADRRALDKLRAKSEE
ncbi:RNA-binding S4 domain-containing protein [uncultured Sneathiella sp.]|jgi:ribosome-associated heat shock protein Hsp15|uniref:RNA-binding S4 domain-containing protein n=1 Tax=uncultured Sneathiella sp. TaxID=879315 RepID=UPI0030D71BE3|tara:strand:- start:41791 stop:42201 length:411 start_codon:yes stop_codon:yes gene_type:complete